eukprot:TRINITY_DN49658_c0_g1_i1.p1 TRINITY_DN49658_c0_g1~~TRINITY_DN49658_c0_g1_i1.p1  ORF type:complete len:192 (+),score=32.48 TRINITY_DN49658_c0_g1_i1:54-629(+)
MAEGAASQGAGGRPNLPGISSGYTRSQAELIWARKCQEELEYVQTRTDNPPKSKKKLGKLAGFDLVRHPTYINARWISSPRESNCSALASVVTGLGPTRLSQLPASLPPMAASPSNLSLRPPSANGAEGSVVSACPSSVPHLEMFKYANHSSEWMRKLEGEAKFPGPNGLRGSALALSSSMKSMQTRRPER